VPDIARGATQQQISWIGGSVALDAAATQNRLAMFRSSMRGGAASPVHVHDRGDETVFVLEGEGIFWAGDQRWQLISGDTAFLPRGVPHTYLFTSDTAEVNTVCNPAGMEEFFRAVGWIFRNRNRRTGPSTSRRSDPRRRPAGNGCSARHSQLATRCPPPTLVARTLSVEVGSPDRSV
jgi:quercetin dioxygenase-like cupin family protein